MNRFRTIFSIGALALVAAPGSLSAQQEVGALYGSVTDTGGNALPEATLTLTGFGELKVQTSDNLGEFRFLRLDPGVWSLEASLEGFSTVAYPAVRIEASRSTTLIVELDAAIKEEITVTAESLLLDERKLAIGTTLRQVELDKLPMARDPWAVLTQAPGVLVDRVDVGGASSDQQARFRAPAVGDDQNDYLLDGMQIAANQLGNASPTYYDFDQFEELQIVTGGNDVTKNTAGVAISLVTKRGSNEPRGSARFLLTEGDGYFGVLEQAESGFDPEDLGPGQQDFVGDSIDRLQDYGFEAGGPAWRNHVWLWGAWSQRHLSKIAGNAEPELFVLENQAIKVNAQISAANSLVASFNSADKRAVGRGAAPNQDRSATRNQRGPTGITKLEDSHVFGSSFFVTASYGYVDGGFEQAAQGGSGPDRPPIPDPGGEMNHDANGFITNTWSGKSSDPQEEVKLDSSYFLTTGAIGHELRFGGRLRETQSSTTFSYPGRNILHYAGSLFRGVQESETALELFGLPPERATDIHLVYAYREGAAPSVLDSRSLWVQDTITWSRWTVNAGLRYDFEEGENLPASVEANLGFPGVMPAIEFEGNDGGGFTFQTLSPRLGVTYAVGEERRTLLRASLSRFPESLDHRDIGRINPVSGQFASILFVDTPGGFPAFFDDGEPFEVVGGLFGFDPANPTALSSSNTTDPDYDPAILDELVVGVEHAFVPELVTGFTLTWRRNERLGEQQPLFGDSLTGEIRTVAADEYLFDGQIIGELPDGTPYTWDTFAAPPHLQSTGGSFLTDGDRSIESVSAALSFTKRLSNRWMARGFVNYVLEEKWQVPASYFDHNDPNRSCAAGPLRTCDPEIDGEGLGGAQSRWQWNLNGMYQVAAEEWWGFNVATNLTGRQGYPILYTQPSFGFDGLFRNLAVVENLTQFRYDDIFIADLRLEKEFAATNNTSLTFSIDAFNIFNEGTVLRRETRLNRATANWVLETVSPRVFRLGVRLNWR